MKVMLMFLGVCLGDLYTRTVNQPVCIGGSNSCSIIARDAVNNQAQNSNISTIRLEVGNQLQATYSYQASDRGNNVVPISAQTEITFVSVAEWVDDGDDVPQTSELSNFDLITPPSTSTFPTAAYGSMPTYIPFTTRQTVNFNFTAICYIVKNDSFSVPPDYITMTGYGSVCHLQVTKSTPIAPNSRIALHLYVDTALPGSGISPTFQNFGWSVLNGATQGRRLDGGGSWIMFAQKGQTPLQLTSQTLVNPSAVTSTSSGVNPNQMSVYFGLVANNQNSFEFDIAFEPKQILYQNNVASITVSIGALFAVFVVAVAV